MLPLIHYFSSLKTKKYSLSVIFDYLSVFFPKSDERYKYVWNHPKIEVNDVFLGRFDFLIKWMINQKKNNLFIVKYFIKTLVILLEKFLARQYENINNIKWERILGSNFKNYDEVFIFVGHQSNRIIKILSIINKLNKNLKLILIPHGITLSKNKLLSKKRFSYQKFNYEQRWKKFDKIMIADKFFYDIVLKSKYSNMKKIKIVGSLRFSKEWLSLKESLEFDKIISFKNQKKIRLLILLPNPEDNCYMEEIFRMIKYLASYKKISLVVQYRINKIKVSIDLKSIKWVTDEYSTSSLINWSNVVIHFGTTMQFECFQKQKIVIYPKYVSMNTLICEDYKVGEILENRDDLVRIFNLINEDFEKFKRLYFSDTNNIDKYILDYVMAGKEKPVLDNYLEFLK